MKNMVTGVVVGALLAACSGPAEPQRDELKSSQATRAESAIFDLPYLMRELENGLRVIVVKTDYPDIVSLQIPVQTGSRNEVEAGKSGFAHFFEHMMFRGTEKYPAAAYAEILKRVGADQNAYTTDDYTNYHITFTKEDLEQIIELEADRFQNLSYSEQDFRTEALAVKGEYLKNYSNPIQKAFERVRDLSFSKHTYAHTTMGFIEDIEEMPDQIEYSRTFFDRWYRPEYTTVIVVGDVDPEATYALVKRYWSDWERGGYQAEFPVEGEPSGPVLEHIRWTAPTQPYLLMAYRGPAFRPNEKDMPAIDLLSSIYFSDSSDLYRKLVLEDQSVDQLVTYFPDRKDPNILLIYARLTDAAHAADVEASIRDTLVDARTLLVDAEWVEKTKSRLRYSFTARLDSSGSIASMLAGFVQLWRTPETVNEVYRSYDRLTAADLRDVANRYFVDSGRVTVTLSNDETLAGVNGHYSIDELVAATVDKRPDPDDLQAPNAAADLAVDYLRAQSEEIPVAIVAEPSSSSPLIDVSILIHSGAGMDPDGKKGLAAMTARMIAEGGSTRHTIQEINEALYPIAAGFNAQVDKEMTRLSGQVHKDNLDIWYRLIVEQLLSPGWREQDFARIKTQAINAIRTGLVGNNDEELGKELLYTALYGPEHPYGSLNLGDVESIESLTLDDLRGFYARHYTINNMSIGLAGGYSERLATRLSNDLQNRPAGERMTLAVPAAPMPVGRQALIVAKETPAVAVSFGFPIELKRGDPDWIALWLARSYLGEHRSTNGHLYRRIRESRGMNYGDYAYIEYFPRGMFQFHPDTNLGRQQQIFQVWIRPLRNNSDAHFATRTAMYELDRLVSDGMSESDFEATRSYLAKFVSLITDGQSRQLGYALDSRYYGIGRFADYVREGLNDLTLEDVNRVIREHVRTDNMQFVFVTGDAEDLENRLADNLPSRPEYEAEMPAALLEEDRRIEQLSLEFDAEDVRIVEAERLF